MKIAELLPTLTKTTKRNSPEILTGLAICGVVSTAYLAVKGAFRASEQLRGEAPDLPLKEQAKIVWKEYIPAGICGVATIGCILGANKANGARTAAAVTAYSLTEKAFAEYKEKVVEQIGKGKEQKIRDEIAQDAVSRNPPTAKEVLIPIGPGYVLCCELFTGRYFRSNMETLRKAEVEINAHVVSDMYVTLEEFYELIGLPNTSHSSRIGWDSNKLMHLEFSTTLGDNGEPCLAFDYNYTKPLFN